MTEWAMKRFWTETSVIEVEDGFAAVLDGRRIMTPNKNPLVVPTRALADEIAAEWQAQEDKIDPLTMPFTRTSNSALEKVRPQLAEVADNLAAYGDSDLLCYRADHPEELIRRQADAWDPVLDWADTRYGARLVPRAGVMHVAQDAKALARLSAEVHAMDMFHLAGFHDLVALTGSLVLGLAATQNMAPADTIWNLSRIDESWQEEQWGADEEATEVAERKKHEFFHAARYFELAGN